MQSKSQCLAPYLCVFLSVSVAAAADKPIYQPIDWNGDGVIDLVDLSPAATAGDRTTLRVHIGTAHADAPKFARAEDIVIEGGAPMPSLADYDGDGDMDLLSVREGSVWVWENSGGTAAPVRLGAPRKLIDLGVSDFRQELARFGNRAAFECRAIAAADWEGDGDQDLLAVMASGGDDGLALFELIERTSKDGAIAAIYAPPTAIRDDRGLPVMSGGGFAVRSILYTDWDRDGDLDLQFYDTTTRPSDAGGWLMFMENDNTRQKPLFMRPFTILPIAGAPFVLDWNGDGQIDLIAAGELFTNVNPKSSTRLPQEPAFRPGGSRRPHPWTLPRFESSGTLPMPAAPE